MSMISHDQYLMISLFLESTQPARINRIHPLRSFNTIDNNCTCQDMPSMFFSSPSCPFPTSPFAVVVVLRQLCRQSDPQHPALEWLVRPTIWLSLGRKINIRVSLWNLSSKTQTVRLKPFVRTQELNIKIHLRCDQSTAFLSFRCTPRFRSELEKKAQH